MGPPDGPSRPNQSDWARMIQTELNSWDPTCLPPSFHPRSTGRPHLAWRPIPLVLAVLLGVLLAATALAAPHGLGGAIETLTGGKPQPKATPLPHAPTGSLMLSPAPARSSAAPEATAAPVASPTQGAQTVASQPTNQPARQAGGGGGAGNQAGTGLPGVQLPPTTTPGQLVPPQPPPTRPQLPTPPPLPVLQPGQTGVPSPSPSTATQRGGADRALPHVNNLPAPASTPRPKPSK